MGYSCSAKAMIAYEAILAGTPKDANNSSNGYRYNGFDHFLEIGKENRDGSITGTIYRNLQNKGICKQCKKAGSFRIEPSGSITRPIYLRRAAYGEGFSKLSETYTAPYLTDIEGQEFANSNYPLYCAAYTENSVLEGDICTIGQNKANIRP